jgi:hypothetical protein
VLISPRSDSSARSSRHSKSLSVPSNKLASLPPRPSPPPTDGSDQPRHLNLPQRKKAAAIRTGTPPNASSQSLQQSELSSLPPHPSLEHQHQRKKAAATRSDTPPNDSTQSLPSSEQVPATPSGSPNKPRRRCRKSPVQNVPNRDGEIQLPFLSRSAPASAFVRDDTWDMPACRGPPKETLTWQQEAQARPRNLRSTASVLTWQQELLSSFSSPGKPGAVRRSNTKKDKAGVPPTQSMVDLSLSSAYGEQFPMDDVLPSPSPATPVASSKRKSVSNNPATVNGFPGGVKK